MLDQLKARGIRVELDASDDRFGKEDPQRQQGQAPFVLIAGGDDRDAGAVSFHFCNGSQRNLGCPRRRGRPADRRPRDQPVERRPDQRLTRCA